MKYRLILSAIGGAALVFILGAGPVGSPSVPNLAALKATPSTQSTLIERLSFATPGDGGFARYRSSPDPCPLNTGAGDDGSQVRSVNGKCWLAIFDGMKVTPKIWGCSGNGTINDAGCMQAAILAVGSGRLDSGPYVYRSNSALSTSVNGFEFVCDSKLYGLRAGAANLNLLSLTGSNQAIRDCSIDMRNNAAFANTSGTAITSFGSNNNIIETNIIGPCFGIDLTGNVTTIEKSRVTFADVNNTGCSGIRVGHTTTLGSTIARINQTVVECPVCSQPAENGLLIEDAGGLFITQSDFLTTKHGTHIAPSTNQQVIWLTANGTYLADGNTSQSIYIEVLAASAKVQGLTFTNTWSSSGAADGVFISNAGGGVLDDIKFNGHRAFLNGNHGFNISGGTNIAITNSEICGNGTAAANTYNGIAVAAGIGQLMLQGNRIRSACAGASNQQFAGIFLVGGGDDVVIQNNDLRGNQSATLVLGGTLTNSRVEGNPGYNPVGAAVITVGASPFTYTAGPSPETIYILAGTVSLVATGGIVACLSTPCTVNLGPNESAVVTYSVLPAMNKSVH